MKTKIQQIRRNQHVRYFATGGAVRKRCEIDNRAAILNEIDRTLGVKKPPSIEYIYVETDFRNILSNISGYNHNISGGGSNSAINPYGHSALRYNIDGQDIVMNVSGARNKKLINFLSTEDYIFGHFTRTDHQGCDQGGIYQRAMRGFRLENVPKENIQQMHQYFLKLKERSDENITAKYSMVWGNTLPFINQYFSTVEKGNCSYWTSKGLQACRLMDRPSMWPKFLFIKLYFQMIVADQAKKHATLTNLLPTNELYTLFHPSNVSIVAYRKEAALKEDPLANSWIAPNWFLSSDGKHFRALERFANAIVCTPKQPLDDADPWCSYVEIETNPFRPLINKES